MGDFSVILKPNPRSLTIVFSINHTTVIILITIAISIFAWKNQAFFNRLVFYPPAVKRGQIDRFLTHGFVHADAMHLIFNMFTLYFFGRIVERFFVGKFGNLGFVVFYVLAIIVAILPSYAKHKNDNRYVSLGASGAVSAVLFCFILFYPWQLIYLFVLIPIPAIIFAIAYVAYSIYADKKGGSNVNHSAHLFGAVFGVAFTILVEPSVIGHFLTALLNPRF